MKLNFKTIIIIFLVALLGAGIGTYGMMSLYQENTVQEEPTTSAPVINEVIYSNKKETSYTDAINKAYNTVVEINCVIEAQQQSNFFFVDPGSTVTETSGSGVIISEDGYIVTNNHVVEGVTVDEQISVKLYNDDVCSAQLIGTDSRTDLAVLKIDKGNLPFSSFADSNTLVMGEEVIAIGNPLGLGISCSNGIISALEKEIYINNVYLTVLQTNAAVNAGNSGGGLFDLNGNIVGIVNAKKSANFTETSVEGMGYAIPSNTASKIVNEIIENGYVKDRAALGIRVYTGNYYASTEGVVVTEVIEDGGADQGGMKVNDIITAVDGTKVTSYADLSKVLDSKNVGDIVKVTVVRNETELELEITLQQSVSK